MSVYEDVDGIDGPFDKAMKRAMRDDAKARKKDWSIDRLNYRCPSCGHRTLSVCHDGSIVCFLIGKAGCKDPSAAHRLLAWTEPRMFEHGHLNLCNEVCYCGEFPV